MVRDVNLVTQPGFHTGEGRGKVSISQDFYMGAKSKKFQKLVKSFLKTYFQYVCEISQTIIFLSSLVNIFNIFH